jgi:hypothetical protein
MEAKHLGIPEVRFAGMRRRTHACHMRHFGIPEVRFKQ